MSGKLTKRFERDLGSEDNSDSDRIHLMNQAMDNKSFDESGTKEADVSGDVNHASQDCDLESVVSDPSANVSCIFTLCCSITQINKSNKPVTECSYLRTNYANLTCNLFFSFLV